MIKQHYSTTFTAMSAVLSGTQITDLLKDYPTSTTDSKLSPEVFSYIMNLLKHAPDVVDPHPPQMPETTAVKHGLKRIFEEPSKDTVKYVMGKRGGCQIVWQGHRYTRDRTRNDQTYWACVLKRPPYRCKGRISTKLSYVTSATAHNHEHQTAKSQTAHLVHKIKQKVKLMGPDADPTNVVITCMDEFKASDLCDSSEQLPSLDTLIKMCKRIIKNMRKPIENSESMDKLSGLNIPKFTSCESMTDSNLSFTNNFVKSLSPGYNSSFNSTSLLNNNLLASNLILANNPLLYSPSLPINPITPSPVSALKISHSRSLAHNHLLQQPQHSPMDVDCSEEVPSEADECDDVTKSMLKRGVSSILEMKVYLDDMEKTYKVRLGIIYKGKFYAP